jgi:hypothetical protein
MKLGWMLLLMASLLSTFRWFDEARQAAVAPEIAFAFSDSAGRRLLSVDKLENPARMTKVVGPGGSVLNVKYLGQPKEGPKSTHRQTAANFDQWGGSLYQIDGGRIPVGDEPMAGTPCLLVTDDFLRARKVLPIIAGRGGAVPSGFMQHVEQAKHKKPVKGDRIAGIGTAHELNLVQFVPEGKTCLASLVLAGAEILSFDDHEAKYDDFLKQYVWRVDTEGISPESFHVLAAWEAKNGIELVVLWDAAEGQNLHLLRSEGPVLRNLYHAYRYWAPV